MAHTVLVPVVLYTRQGSHCVSWCCLAAPPRLITDPLLTAAFGDFNSPGVLAPNSGGLRLITQRDTSDHPIHTQTLVFAIGLEALAIVKDHTIVLTASALQIGTCSFFVPRRVCAVITVKATMMVTVFFLIANLPQLFGTCSAAIAAVHDQAHTWQTGGGSFRTFAGPLAVLSAVIGLRGDGVWYGQHLRGILGKCSVNLWYTSK